LQVFSSRDEQDPECIRSGKCTYWYFLTLFRYFGALVVGNWATLITYNQSLISLIGTISNLLEVISVTVSPVV
jgi:hypothetical protein